MDWVRPDVEESESSVAAAAAASAVVVVNCAVPPTALSPVLCVNTNRDTGDTDEKNGRRPSVGRSIGRVIIIIIVVLSAVYFAPCSNDNCSSPCVALRSLNHQVGGMADSSQITKLPVIRVITLPPAAFPITRHPRALLADQSNDGNNDGPPRRVSGSGGACHSNDHHRPTGFQSVIARPPSTIGTISSYLQNGERKHQNCVRIAPGSANSDDGRLRNK
ncbi:unnamed protein product [Soboliphyme baturini]|uniref:Uncharacterized protein n=1 Tax=Soboliphyme baturini TaxID=241478 RepID=A0A183IK93_9BILA|nr:unnamed protein product [Soboliphyme baturini]